ncbi:transporter [Tsukamurella pseudospumae]|uniref:Transporter n=2 Tax=Tsukamurella pseudospumae TaxID=239498 RepID=A0A138AVQ0_9ACTN|nr:transporter [Tsukamurella pseudospumae]KXO89473.1 transporter [Tsukamurella pseudospumae]KXP14528.1 transporter [Tsukamurella pseudospumae]
MILSDIVTLLIVLVVLALLFSLMMLGWRRRGQRQAAAVGEIPTTPEQLRDLVFGPVSGVYVGSTVAPHWQDRVAVGDWGFRATVNLSRYADGYLMERGRGNPMWIADERIVEVRRASKLAGKVMPGDGLLVLRWELPTGTVIDTGFRADDKTTYRKLMDKRETE